MHCKQSAFTQDVNALQTVICDSHMRMGVHPPALLCSLQGTSSHWFRGRPQAEQSCGRAVQIHMWSILSNRASVWQLAAAGYTALPGYYQGPNTQGLALAGSRRLRGWDARGTGRCCSLMSHLSAVLHHFFTGLWATTAAAARTAEDDRQAVT